MRAASPGRPELTYCTNIHAGESLEEVRRILSGPVSRVKERLSPGAPFGVGLRLSARASEELVPPPSFEAFHALLDELGLYVFTINGFPYGAFHGERIKDAVYRPDWRERPRVDYSDRLATQLATLLPNEVSGSVSTVPGAFGARVSSGADAAEIARNVRDHAATLFRLKERTGRDIELALEPEPCCFLETTPETVRFFEEYLLSRAALEDFSSLTGTSLVAAETFLRRHVSVCLDACHLAAQFEEPGEALRLLRAAGIRVGKVQVTTALVAHLSGRKAEDERVLSELERFAEGVYLHQVVARRGDELVRHLDLPEAIAAARRDGSPAPEEWRVHFHVPVFTESIAPFGTTRAFLRDLLRIAANEPVSEHFEVETYTWDVLPAQHRTGTVEEAIVRELEWTLAELENSPRKDAR